MWGREGTGRGRGGREVMSDTQTNPTGMYTRNNIGFQGGKGLAASGRSAATGAAIPAGRGWRSNNSCCLSHVANSSRLLPVGSLQMHLATVHPPQGATPTRHAPPVLSATQPRHPVSLLFAPHVVCCLASHVEQTAETPDAGVVRHAGQCRRLLDQHHDLTPAAGCTWPGVRESSTGRDNHACMLLVQLSMHATAQSSCCMLLGVPPHSRQPMSAMYTA